DYNAGMTYYGDKAKPRAYAARFASPDRDELISVVIKPSNQLKITFLEAKDITDLGTLKEASKIFVPAGAKIFSARTIKVKEEEDIRTNFSTGHITSMNSWEGTQLIDSYAFTLFSWIISTPGFSVVLIQTILSLIILNIIKKLKIPYISGLREYLFFSLHLFVSLLYRTGYHGMFRGIALERGIKRMQGKVTQIAVRALSIMMRDQKIVARLKNIIC
ncbi:hypothetical protein ACJX0J_034107, partial [Zea mays]